MNAHKSHNRSIVASLLALMPLAAGTIACIPTDSAMPADASAPAAQIAGQLLTFILDFARQALAAFLF